MVSQWRWTWRKTARPRKTRYPARGASPRWTASQRSVTERSVTFSTPSPRGDDGARQLTARTRRPSHAAPTARTTKA